MRNKPTGHGDGDPDNDIVRTPEQARQGAKGRNVKTILIVSLILAAVAGFLVWYGVVKI